MFTKGSWAAKIKNVQKIAILQPPKTPPFETHGFHLETHHRDQSVNFANFPFLNLETAVNIVCKANVIIVCKFDVVIVWKFDVVIVFKLEFPVFIILLGKQNHDQPGAQII